MLEPASGRPNRSSLRAIERSKPKRTGSKTRKRTAPATAPATRPTPRLMAPMPPSAQPIETTAEPQLITWSTSSRRPARNSRWSSAADVATTPLSTTLKASTRTTSVASGAPMAEQKSGASQGRHDEEQHARERAERRHGGGDLARGAGPAHDREAHAQLVEAQHRREGRAARPRRCRTPPDRGCARAPRRWRTGRSATPRC